MRPVSPAILLGLAWLLLASETGRAQQAAAPTTPTEPPLTAVPANAAPAASAPLPNSGFLGLGVDDRRDGGAGVYVLAVHPQSPAALAGLKPQDLLVAIDGKPVASRAEFGRLMNSLPPGHQVRLEYQRGDLQHTNDVKLGTRPADLNAVPQGIAAAPAAPGAAAPPAAFGPPTVQTLPPSATLAAPGPPLLGVRTMPVSQAMQLQLGLPHSRGAYVADIVPGSPAEAGGVPIGSIIWAFNKADIDNPAALATAIMQAGPGARVLLTLSDRGRTRRINVVLAGSKAAPGAAPWKAVEQAATADDGAPIDATTVALLKDEIRELTEELKRLEAKLKAVGIDPQTP